MSKRLCSTLFSFFSQEEADKCRKRRDTTFEVDKQFRLAIQEIEQVDIKHEKS